MIGNLWRAVCRSACESRGGIGSTTKPRSDENNDTWIFADSATKPRYFDFILVLIQWLCLYQNTLYKFNHHMIVYHNHNQNQDGPNCTLVVEGR